MFDKNGKRISATIILSVPRLMFTANFNCILNSVAQCGFRVITAEGVYYDQTNTGAIQKVWDSEFLFFVDYDSVFNVEMVKKLFQIMIDNPHIDALVPIQISRHTNSPICYNPETNYTDPVAKIMYGHFGCTIIKSSVFKKMTHPWFCPKPNAEGKWEEGKIDTDTSFWKKASDEGFQVYQANEICIGHMELFCKWPHGMDSIIVQPVRDINIVGVPKEAHFGIKPDTENKFKINLED